MSVAFGILRSFNATIACASAPMSGTVFTIKIPLAN